MNTLFVPLFLFSFLASITLAQQALVINSITGVTVCDPVLLTWMGGVAPYYLEVLPKSTNDPNSALNASPLVQFAQQTGTSLTWVVNVTAGTAAFLQLRDNTGATAESGDFTVMAGTSTSCLGSTSTGPSSAGTNTPISAGPNPAVLAGTGTTTGSSAPASGSAGLSSASSTRPATSTGTGAAPSSMSSSAAAHHYAPVGTLAMSGVAAFVFTLVL